MKYALVSYAEPGVWDTLTDEERAAWEADDAAFNAELAELHGMVTGIGLEDTAAVTPLTVRASGGEATVTDGPYAETAEVLGGLPPARTPTATWCCSPTRTGAGGTAPPSPRAWR
jgi:hypothetical protein